MAITTYAELQTAIQNLFDDTAELASARVQEHITLAEAMIRRELRCREMEDTTDLTISAQTVALPTNFLGVRRLYLNTDPKQRLEYLAPENFWIRYLATETGDPEAFTIEGGNFIFGPSPDATYTGKLLFWEWVGALSASNTPTLFTNHPDLYLYASAMHSADYLEDNGKVLKYAAAAKDIMESIMRADDRDRFSQGPLVALSDVYAV